MTGHLYVAPFQPATKYTVEVTNEIPPFEVRIPPRKLLFCRACGKRRWALNLVVQVYYDEIYFWCRPGKGCKA